MNEMTNETTGSGGGTDERGGGAGDGRGAHVEDAARNASEYFQGDDAGAPRERIVSAASHLFRRFGFRAVGVDLIAKESDVAKMTMYRYFDSKDDLIVEFLQREDRSLRSWLHDVTCQVDGSGPALKAFFRALESRTLDPKCFGCPFQIAATEFPDADHPANRQARRHKAWMREVISEWVRQTGRRNVEETTEQLYVLVEGAWARARMNLGSPTRGYLVEGALLLLEGGRFLEAIARSTPD
ncbi:MAG: TetR/AcrR family transcriptional regulator [Rhodothermales bacterium]